MSEEKSHKGLSLRRKKTTRPTISAPRQISKPSAIRNPSSDNSQWNDAPAREARPSLGNRDNTSDLVKRRYSTRFTGNGPLVDGLAPPVPAVPSLPAQYAPTARPSGPRSPSIRADRSQEHVEGGKLQVDVRALADPHLSADKYVQKILADATERDIRAYQSELEDVKAHTSIDLQQNVYQNRTQFIRISKEADKLKSEMQTLRTLMSELTGTLGNAASAGGSEGIDAGDRLSMSDRKRLNRSSVANLEAMWTTHLQVLWKRVEGSQKHLPALPGRHIIMESQRWVELNAATWKPRRRVALVLLNDHLLVASEKKRNDMGAAAAQNGKGQTNGNRQSMHGASAVSSSQSRLVTERCWALQDVSLADIGHSSTTGATDRENKAIANAISIRAGNESFTYAVLDPAEKAGMIVAFRKAQEDLRRQLVAEQGARERRFDERGLASAALAAGDGEEGVGLSRSTTVIIDADGRVQSVRWFESQIDGLDIDIALQRFEEAVDRVDKLRRLARGIKGNATAQDVFLAKINERAARLANNIARQLVLSSAKTDRTKTHVSWLLRLGYEEMARTRYLEARTDVLTLRSRQLPFTGALVPHLHALAFTTFTLILNTLRTFSSSFPSVSGSAAIRWAKERVDDFNGLLARQLSSVDRNSPLWTECMTTVREQATILEEAGVHFTALVGRDLETLTAGGTAPSATRAETRSAVAGLGVSS